MARPSMRSRSGWSSSSSGWSSSTTSTPSTSSAQQQSNFAAVSAKLAAKKAAAASAWWSKVINLGKGSIEGGPVKTNTSWWWSTGNAAAALAGIKARRAKANSSAVLTAQQEINKKKIEKRKADRLVANNNLTTINTQLGTDLKSTQDPTWLKRTDNLIGEIDENKNENINFIDKTKNQLLDKNIQLGLDLEKSNDRQQDIVDQRLSTQDQWLQTVLNDINEMKNIDVEKLNRSTTQNAQALSQQLADQWFLNSEQAAQASAWAISKVSEATQLKILDIDAKAAELTANANQQYLEKKDAILAQQGVNESQKAQQLKELNANYTNIVQELNLQALNEKKAAEAQEIALKQWLAEPEITGEAAEIQKEQQAISRLKKLESANNSPQSKMVYLFSALSSYFGSDVVTDAAINTTLAQLQENGTIASAPISNIFTAIKNKIIADQKKLKA